MLSSLRAVAPRRISCCLRSQTSFSNYTFLSPRSLLSKQSGQSTIPSLLISNSRCSFHTSQVLRQQAAYEEGEVEGEGENDVGLPTAKSAALDNLSTRTKGSGQSSTLNADGLETTFTGLRDSGLIDARVMSTIIEDMGYVDMTDVQTKTITPSLGSRDILAQARTGTGKTMAFLLPTIQKLLKNKTAATPEERDPRLPRSFGGKGVIDIRALIISPTRELALQIEKEAEKLTKNTPLVVQSAVGGTGKREAMADMRRQGCDILVATPGRLIDLLQDGASPVKVPKLDVYVLDEADSLLDQGFAPDLIQINNELPDRKEHDRQTLFYSATFSKNVEQIAKQTLKRDAVFINTVDPNEEPTHKRVPQVSLVVKSFENVLPTLLELVGRERELAKAEGKPFKAMIFSNTTRSCTLNANVFRMAQHAGKADDNENRIKALDKIEIHEIQGRLEQEQRSRVAERFRRAHEALLFTSDVTARGMDFPNVTHIIQIGLMMSRESYIHRLGRTARGSSTTTGKGFLIITSPEQRAAVPLLEGIPLKSERFEATDSLKLKCLSIDMSAPSTIDRKTADILTTITQAASRVKEQDKNDMYLAMIGYYKGQKVNFEDVVSQMGRLCRFQWGMDKPCPVPPGLLSKMGIGRRDMDKYDLNVMTRSYGDEDSSSSSGRSGSFERSGGSSYGGGDRGGGRSFGGYRGDRGGFGGGDRSDRGGFGGDRPPRREYGDRSSSSRGNFGDRGGGSSRGGYSDRPARNYGDSSSSGGDRGSSFGDRPPRRDFGDRGGFSSRGGGGYSGGSSGSSRGGSSRFGRSDGRDKYSSSSGGDRPSRDRY